MHFICCLGQTRITSFEGISCYGPQKKQSSEKTTNSQFDVPVAVISLVSQSVRQCGMSPEAQCCANISTCPLTASHLPDDYYFDVDVRPARGEFELHSLECSFVQSAQ